MKFDVQSRWTGKVQFSATIECAEGAPLRVKMGLAIKWARSNGADLRGAFLGGADLRGAVLRDADLRGAVLGRADLREYKVNGTFGIVDAGQPNHWFSWGYVEHGGTIRVRVGCRHFELGEGRAYWSRDRHPEKQNRREILAALDYIEAVMKLRGWEKK